MRLSAGYVLSHGVAENGIFAQILSHASVLFYESHANRVNPCDKQRDYSTLSSTGLEQALDLTHEHRKSHLSVLGLLFQMGETVEGPLALCRLTKNLIPSVPALASSIQAHRVSPANAADQAGYLTVK